MTERAAKPAKPAPRLDLDGVEWRLVIAAWLGVVYVVSWFALRGPAPMEPAPAPAVAEAPARPVAPRSKQPAFRRPDITTSASRRAR